MARALVIGDTGGIGAALRDVLQGQGAEVLGLSRRQDRMDVTQEHSIKTAFAGLSGAFDTVIIATGALEIDGHAPEKTLRSVTPEALRAQFETNAMGPFLVVKHLVPFLPRDRPCHVGVLSARVGSIGDNRLGGWYSYRMAKAALNQLIHTAAIELARSHKHAVLAALHPGTVATEFTARYAATHERVPPDIAARNLLWVLHGLTPEQSGGFYDWAGAEVPW